MEELKNKKTLIEKVFETEDTTWEGKSFISKELFFSSLVGLEEFLKMLIKKK